MKERRRGGREGEGERGRRRGDKREGIEKRDGGNREGWRK